MIFLFKLLFGDYIVSIRFIIANSELTTEEKIDKIQVNLTYMRLAGVIDHINNSGESYTHLGQAFVIGDLKLIRFLIAEGANVNAPGHENGYSLLHIASINNHFHLIRFLIDVIKVRVDFITDSPYGEPYQGQSTTAMASAAIRGNIKIISLLLKHMEYSFKQLEKIKENVSLFLKLRTFEDENTMTDKIRNDLDSHIFSIQNNALLSRVKSVLIVEPNLYSRESSNVSWNLYAHDYGLLTTRVEELKHIESILDYLIVIFKKYKFSKMSEYRNYINNVVANTFDEVDIPKDLINNFLMPYFDENHTEFLKSNSIFFNSTALKSSKISRTEESMDEDELSEDGASEDELEEDDFTSIVGIYQKDLMNATVHQPLALQYANLNNNPSSSSSSSTNAEFNSLHQEVNASPTWQDTPGRVLDSKAEIGALKPTKEELRAIHNRRF